MPICSLALCFVTLLLLATAVRGAPTEPTFHNPIVRQRADPFVMRDADGTYYFTATVPEYDRIELRSAKTIDGLGTAEPRAVWHKHTTGPMGSHIWAPELHKIDGKWFIYFAAGEAEHVWNIRIYVLENNSPNPLEGEWIERGQLKTQWESFALDATTFEHKGANYLVWAQHDPKEKNNTDLYIAKMTSPTSIDGAGVMISRPTFPWELELFKVNEGPAVLIRNGKVFITFSASGTDWHYCMGLLTADANADLLDAKSWHKTPTPIFATNVSAKVFGPGHNSFTTLPDGRDVLIYHARDYKEIKGDPLHDPNRNTRAQVFGWNADGTPNFGLPLGD